MNKALLKDALALMVITLISGCLLGVVYKVTKKPIAHQQELTKQKAYQSVFPEAQSFFEVEQVNPQEDAEKVLSENGLEGNTIEEILAVSSEKDKGSTDSLIGYVMTITNKEAYGGEITFTLGIKADGSVNGISFTDIQETAGLGMKAEEESFRNQYKGQQVQAFQVTKSGSSKEGEIDALSGATITSNAVTNGVNAGLAYFRYVTGGGSNE